MTNEAFLSINGVRANKAQLRVPHGGRWTIDIVLDGSVVPSGPVVVRVGALELHGTVDPDFRGAFVAETSVRVVAGSNGWPKSVPARSYHNDALVKRADVLAALARDAGETIDTTGDTARLAVDFTRVSGPASQALKHILGATPWRVDFDGVTRYGARPAASLGSDVEILEANPKTKRVIMTATDPSSVPIGAIITDARLSQPLTISEIEVDISSASLRITASCRDVLDESLIAGLRAMMPLLVPREPFLGPRRYRVVRMVPSVASATNTRVELQIVQAATGLPDLLMIPVWPGLAGALSQLTPGAHVLVQFIDGDPGQPYLTAFSTADDPAWRPVSTRIDVANKLYLGDPSNTEPVARAPETQDAIDKLTATVNALVALIAPPPPAMPGSPVLTVSPVTPLLPLVGLSAGAAAKVEAE